MQSLVDQKIVGPLRQIYCQGQDQQTKRGDNGNVHNKVRWCLESTIPFPILVKPFRGVFNFPLHLKFPVSRHDSTEEAARWIQSWSTPQCATDAPTERASSIRVGGSRAARSISRYRTGTAVDSKLPPCNEFTWTALISEHAKCGQHRQALKLFEEMRESGVKPSSYTFVAALKACNSLRDLESAQQIHVHMEESGFKLDVYVGTTLVDVYAKCGSLVSARRVFDQMPARDVVLWNAMILGYAQMEEGEVALQLYEQMCQEGLVPNERTFLGVLKGLSSLAAWKGGNEGDQVLVRKRCLQQVRCVHSDLVKRHFESDMFLTNMLLDVYAKCGSLADARLVFEMMPCRDVVSWNSMISGYAQAAEGEEALRLYVRMQQDGAVPDDRTFLGALKACSTLAALEKGNKDAGKCVKRWCLEQLGSIHRGIGMGGLVPDVYVGNILVDAYAKCGSLVDARRVFDMLPHRDVVCWTAMILGYAQMERGDVALQLYGQMQLEGVVPNDRTFVGALKACGSVAGLDKGREIHAQIVNSGFGGASDSFVASSLIDMYGKCGNMEDALKVFDGLPSRNSVIWNALIAGYARQGESAIVFELFERMRWSEAQPEAITFVSVLTACSHVGLLDKGEKYFEVMTEEYGITPTVEHCSCMVDLLGRAGQLEKAMAMAKSSQANTVVWKSMLSACRKWGKVELGRQAFDSAVRLDRNDAAVYLLMWHIYTAADMWEESKEIQSMRVNAQAWKQPGQSWWTDTYGTVHTFVVGDQGHPESQAVYAKLHNLVLRMGDVGYVFRHPENEILFA